MGILYIINSHFAPMYDSGSNLVWIQCWYSTSTETKQFVNHVFPHEKTTVFNR